MARGRPLNPEKQQQTRQALKQAAKALLENKPYRSITIRELASKAGTQSAMVSYYFGSKEGLFINMLEESAARRLVFVQKLTTELDKEPEHILDILVEGILTMMLAEPWLVFLMRDEVLSYASGLRKTFLETMPHQLLPILKNLLARLQEKELLREDLNLEFAITTVFSNVFFPLLAEPVLADGLQVDRTTLASESWKEHLRQVIHRALCLGPVEVL